MPGQQSWVNWHDPQDAGWMPSSPGSDSHHDTMEHAKMWSTNPLWTNEGHDGALDNGLAVNGHHHDALAGMHKKGEPLSHEQVLACMQQLQKQVAALVDRVLRVESSPPKGLALHAPQNKRGLAPDARQEAMESQLQELRQQVQWMDRQLTHQQQDAQHLKQQLMQLQHQQQRQQRKLQKYVLDPLQQQQQQLSPRQPTSPTPLSPKPTSPTPMSPTPIMSPKPMSPTPTSPTSPHHTTFSPSHSPSHEQGTHSTHSAQIARTLSPPRLQLPRSPPSQQPRAQPAESQAGSGVQANHEDERAQQEQQQQVERQQQQQEQELQARVHQHLQRQRQQQEQQQQQQQQQQGPQSARGARNVSMNVPGSPRSPPMPQPSSPPLMQQNVSRQRRRTWHQTAQEDEQQQQQQREQQREQQQEKQQGVGRAQSPQRMPTLEQRRQALRQQQQQQQQQGNSPQQQEGPASSRSTASQQQQRNEQNVGTPARRRQQWSSSSQSLSQSCEQSSPRAQPSHSTPFHMEAHLQSPSTPPLASPTPRHSTIEVLGSLERAPSDGQAQAQQQGGRLEQQRTMKKMGHSMRLDHPGAQQKEALADSPRAMTPDRPWRRRSSNVHLLLSKDMPRLQNSFEDIARAWEDQKMQAKPK